MPASDEPTTPKFHCGADCPQSQHTTCTLLNFINTLNLSNFIPTSLTDRPPSPPTYMLPLLPPSSSSSPPYPSDPTITVLHTEIYANIHLTLCLSTREAYTRWPEERRFVYKAMVLPEGKGPDCRAEEKVEALVPVLGNGLGVPNWRDAVRVLKREVGKYEVDGVKVVR